MGESLGECCSGSALFVFNGIDLLCGFVLAVYGLFLGARSLSLSRSRLEDSESDTSTSLSLSQV